jgi:hypothetical protein
VPKKIELRARRFAMALVVLVGCAEGAGAPEGYSEPDAGPIPTPDATPAPKFDVTAALATGGAHVRVTFDSSPTASEAADASHYQIPGLTVLGAVASGTTVVLQTSVQTATTYTVTVSGVTRASDSEPLTMASADFTGRPPFTVASAASTGEVSLTVTFDAPPNPIQAAKLANYAVPGLTLSGAPLLSGSTVTLATSGQAATTYTITVTNVTRASDGEPLATPSAMLAGTPVLPPTVTNVDIVSTLPDNGRTPYNTGVTTVRITGTEFLSVTCPTGVALDDQDAAGVVVATHPSRCSVTGPTVITADFPAGIRTHGATGWNVRVTNTAGTNATSDVPFAPLAGLLVSEVVTGTSASSDHELVEVYNPTSTPIDPRTGGSGIGLHLHLRSSTGSDSGKTLTAVTSGPIPAHGFLLIASQESATGEPWSTHIDFTYSASSGNTLVPNGAVYLSLSSTHDAKVLDEVGWGTQPAPGFEGTAAANVPVDSSAVRKPGGGVGHATDSDDNSADLTVVASLVTPKGTTDPIEPGPTFNVVGAAATSASRVTVTFDLPPDATQAQMPGNYTIAGLSVLGASVAGNVVTLTTSVQAAAPYTVNVANVTRALDGLALTTASADFTGRAPFDVSSATSTSDVSVVVAFDAPPDPTQAETAGNYVISGLSVTGAILSGSTVTLTTSGQGAGPYTVTVSAVTRASDGEPLTIAGADFAGTPVVVPTVTDVAVISTSPDNDAVAFNTGNATVKITGTGFETTVCPGAVALDDLDGAGAAVGTVAQSCTVDGPTQITAVFGPGIRTRGATGWNVRVTNLAGTNTTSAVPFVPVAGLLVAEIYTGTAGATDHEYLEVYNPTGTVIDPVQLGLHLHIRSSTGTDTNKPLTAVTARAIPAHGFLLLASSKSAAGDPWLTHIDYTYSATSGNSLVANGGAYLSLSTAPDAFVLDKVGWGAQAAPGFEGNASLNIPSGESAQRRPSGASGHGTDTDDNAADFLPPSTTLEGLGTGDPPAP